MDQIKTILNTEKKTLQLEDIYDDLNKREVESMYKELSKELEEKIGEEIDKLIYNSIYDKTSTGTSSTKTSDIDFGKLQELFKENRSLRNSYNILSKENSCLREDLCNLRDEMSKINFTKHT